MEIAVLLNRYAEYNYLVIPANRAVVIYSDTIKMATWGMLAVEKLSCAGVINGNNGEFMPTKDATRVEAAQLLINFVTYVAKGQD